VKWGKATLSENETLELAEVAQLYYIEDLTQEHIASRIGTSRSNVSRMIKEARMRGLVEIQVHSPLGTVAWLQDSLKDRLGLKECLVLSSSDQAAQTPDANSLASKIGALATRYLQEVVADGSTVAVGWSSTVYHHVVNSGYLHHKKGVTVAQLMGSVGGSIPELNGMHMVSRLAAALGADTYYLHAPVLVSNTTVRDALLRDRTIRKTLEVAQRADTMLVGIGAIDTHHGQYRTGYLDDEDLEYIRNKNAVGDICGSYFSCEGRLISLEMSDRTIALDFESMSNIPTRIGVSWGTKKVLANIGAARSGLINVLVTDDSTAEEMLDVLSKNSISPST
jgi:DNA-binding transcriptional regulator LsrR (DeoR family)